MEVLTRTFEEELREKMTLGSKGHLFEQFSGEKMRKI